MSRDTEASDRPNWSRRKILGSGVGALGAGLAGCLGDGGDSDGGDGGNGDGGNGGAAGAGVTSNVQEIYDTLDALGPEAVAEDTIVTEWNDDANTSDDVRAFYPTWDRNRNGTANILNTDTGLWTDIGTGDQGGVVEMALIAASGVSFRRGHTARGKTWIRGLRELRSGVRRPHAHLKPRRRHERLLRARSEEQSRRTWRIGRRV